MPKALKKPVYDMISIGDATLDVFVNLIEANVLCNLQKDVCQLCLSYADKIPVEKVQRVIGGNAANNAVGSSRLGLKAAFYSIVGNDETGKQILETVKREKVSTEYVHIDRKQESNYSVVLNYKAERTILVYHIDRKYKLPKFETTKWVYLTSMGKNHLNLHAELQKYILKTGTKLGFNPGTHQLKQGLEKLRPLLEVTDVLFVNKEEAKRIVGEIADMKELLMAIRHVGPKIAVITDGDKGSYTYDGQKFWQCGVTDTPVFERTGAGDSFATAFLAALQHGKDIPEALRWGSMNSASVITKVGPQAGLLTKSQMAAWLRKFPKMKVNHSDMLTTLKKVLADAHKRNYAVGAFNTNNLEITQAIIGAAVALKSPVIIQTSEGAIEYAGMNYLKAMVYEAAKAKVPVVFHLDHGKDLKVVKQAIDSGYTSVMYDGSALPDKENTANTKKVVAWAKKKGVSVEAEIGAIAGIEDFVSVEAKDAHLTNPERALAFVKATKCDALAIAVGTLHGAFKFKGETILDYDRISAIKKLVKMPLVLHGASGISPELVERAKSQCSILGDCARLENAHGVSDAAIAEAVKRGINKINIDSDLRIAFTAGVREALMNDKKAIDPRKIVGPARALMMEVVKHKMELFGSAGKA